MASYTENLNLLKKDPVADGADTFNIESMLNDNWDKIDAAKGKIDADLSNKADRTPPQEYDLPFSVPITSELAKYSKNQFEEVTFDIYCTISDELNDGTILAVFPEGYRPRYSKTLVMSGVIVPDNIRFTGSFSINKNGNINVFTGRTLHVGTIIFGGGTFAAGS